MESSVCNEKIRALMQYGGRNYACAVVYLTRVKKNLIVADYVKNNVGHGSTIKNYEIDHKWFESKKGTAIKLEDKILSFLGLNPRDLIMKEEDKSFLYEKITFEDAVKILAPVYFKSDRIHKKEELECATAFKLLMDEKNLTFQDLANELGVSKQLVNLMSFRRYLVSYDRLQILNKLLGKQMNKFIKKGRV